MKNNIQLIGPELFGEQGVNAFVLLDGASVPGLVQLLHRCSPQYECLYRGELKPDIAEVAPYVVQLEADTEFTDLVLNQGWGKHWGVFALTPEDLFAMRQHLRRFLTVHDSAGKPNRRGKPKLKPANAKRPSISDMALPRNAKRAA